MGGMGKIIKPFAGPAVTFLFALGVDVSSLQNDTLAGILWGIAGAWLIVTLLSHEALIRRFPRVIEWLPFLDSSGGFAAEHELRSNHLQGKTIKIAVLVEDGCIYGRTFTDCVIHGPAIVVASDYTYFAEPVFKTYGSNLHLSIPFEDGKTQVTDLPAGIIVTQKCTFTRCTFVRIGFVATPDQVLKDKQEIKVQGTGATLLESEEQGPDN